MGARVGTFYVPRTGEGKLTVRDRHLNLLS